jgi:hypothetical protein
LAEKKKFFFFFHSANKRKHYKLPYAADATAADAVVITNAFEHIKRSKNCLKERKKL